jgi:hypothetical protein
MPGGTREWIGGKNSRDREEPIRNLWSMGDFSIAGMRLIEWHQWFESSIKSRPIPHVWKFCGIAQADLHSAG